MENLGSWETIEPDLDTTTTTTEKRMTPSGSIPSKDFALFIRKDYPVMLSAFIFKR
jgi:hypothetical protein